MNFDKLMEGEIAKNAAEGKTPRLLLHSCCAPCSSYVLKLLSKHYCVSLVYFNPNIYPAEEYGLRKSEQLRLLDEMTFENPVRFEECGYDDKLFYKAAKGRENEVEGGERCRRCIELRLRFAAEYAATHGFDYFTTTLSVSPYKNAEFINDCGEALEKEYGVRFLHSDFKKRDGYKQSIELSKKYNLYRQHYCGCIFSLQEAIKKGETKK